MLSVLPTPPEGMPATDAALRDAVWIDLLRPEEGEVARVEALTGLHVPARAELVEIESSSRLAERGGALYLTYPAAKRDGNGDSRTTPVGFVLTRERLLSVRFDEMLGFDSFAGRCRSGERRVGGGMEVFVGLCEVIIDRLADVLEREGDGLDRASHRIFRHGGREAPAPRKADLELRAVLRNIGHAGDLISKIRDTLLGLGRILPYVQELAKDWTPAELRPRLKTMRADIQSLTDYDLHLANKVQFLLDATLGYINIEQNNIIRVLTVVSVVGVPPTFVASMYGMNFTGMPELHWQFGYAYALILILASAVLPMLWFRVRGWL
jgi:magnesium transporter